MIACNLQRRRRTAPRPQADATCGGRMSGIRNLIIIAIGVLLITLGFVTLAAGSMTLAPALLIAGYCIVVPLGLIIGVRREGRHRGGSQGERANSSVG
jgi:hypothetical protein